MAAAGSTVLIITQDVIKKFRIYKDFAGAMREEGKDLRKKVSKEGMDRLQYDLKRLKNVTQKLDKDIKEDILPIHNSDDKPKNIFARISEKRSQVRETLDDLKETRKQILKEANLVRSTAVNNIKEVSEAI